MVLLLVRPQPTSGKGVVRSLSLSKDFRGVLHRSSRRSHSHPTGNMRTIEAHVMVRISRRRPRECLSRGKPRPTEHEKTPTTTFSG